MIGKAAAAILLLAVASARANAPATCELTGVQATLDRMPGPSFVQPNVELTLTLRLRNLANADVPVRVERAFTSYDPGKRGTELKELAVTDRKICGSDSCASFTLPAGAELGTLSISGQGLSPSGQGHRLYVTLVLLVGQEPVELRGVGDLLVAD